MRTHLVPQRDGTTLTVIGKCIGQASSANRPRWTEVKVIRTDTGRYVVHTIGRSTVIGEVDRHTSYVCDDAAGAVERLHRYDGDGVRFITEVAIEAARQAANADVDFRHAWLGQRVA